jgi:O-antigen ligase
VRGSFGLIPLAGAAAWGLIQLATGQTVSRWETWNATLGWAANLAGFWLALQICEDAKVRRALLRGLVAFAFAISLISVLQYFTAPDKLLWLYTPGGTEFGPFESPNRYAAFAELLAPVALLQAARGERIKWFYASAAATLFAAVIAGASRAGSALMVAEVLTLGLLGWGQRRLGRMVAVFAAMAFVFTAVVGVETLVRRFAGADPYAGRREFLQSAVAMTKDRPAMGFGLGNFENAYPAYARVDIDQIVNHAHNDWAEWAADGGLPFLLLMVCLAAWVIPKAVRSVWGVGVLAVLAHSTVDFPLQSPAIEIWVFTLIGVLAADRRPERAAPNLV